MADDRDTTANDVPDPWGDIGSSGGDATADGFDFGEFSFEEQGESASPNAQPDTPPPHLDAEAGGPGVPAGDDAVHAVPGSDAAGHEPPKLGIAPPSEPADLLHADVGHAAELEELSVQDSASGEQDGDEAMLIGGGAWDDPAPAADGAERAAEQSADSFGLGEFSDSSESTSEAASAQVVAAVAPKRPAPQRKPKKKSGGIGQMIGIVLGGALAIPVTLGILVWGFGKDPFGTTRHVPEQLAFLLPQKFQRGGRERGVDLGLKIPQDPPRRRTEDDPGVRPPADPVGDPLVNVDDPLTPAPKNDPVDDPADIDPTAFIDPLDEPPGKKPPADRVVVPPPPPPLDMSALVAAIGEAEAAAEAIRTVSDAEDPARRPLLIEWYKRLVKVADELVLLERTAADSGRPLARAPEGVAALHAAIAAQGGLRDELARLGRMWVSATKRNGDGVVLPLTFESARRVGPYWSSQATLQLPKGEPRRIVVVSRGEPAAVAGDAVVVTGVILGDGVIWAADVRGAAAAEPVSPFGG